MNNFMFDITIIGGGASGIMAAISAKRTNPELNIALVEGSFTLGRKLLLSGAGRCNLTNTNLSEKDFITHYNSDNLEYVEGIFNQFGYQEIIEFFNDLGIDVFEEKAKGFGKIYPVSESAKNVINILTEELKRHGVEIFLNTECTDIGHKDKNFIIKIIKEGKKQIIDSTKVILTSGGMSYPSIGKYGRGFEFANNFGHKIFSCIPVAVPLLSKDKFCKNSAGIKVRAQLQCLINGLETEEIIDDILFTSYGLSGTGILRLSTNISKQFASNSQAIATIVINFLPDILKEDLIQRLTTHGDERLWITLLGLLPTKLVDSILIDIYIQKDTCINELSEVQRKKVLDILYDKQIQISGTKGWNHAEFTAGGISINEIDPKTLESILQKNLYFAGEVLNVDGEIGGYNLSWAWASGFIAGVACAQSK
jgi:hypothetical protein